MPDGRPTFRDWAAEETNHPREVVEAGLANVVQNKVEAAYARSDLFERRRPPALPILRRCLPVAAILQRLGVAAAAA